MTSRATDISGLNALIEQAETTVANAQEGLTIAAAELARIVGPLATAHRLAELAIEMAELAKDQALG